MFSSFNEIDGYGFYNEAESDEDNNMDSSEEDEKMDDIKFNFQLNTTQTRKKQKNVTGEQASSSEDEFEELMNDQLDSSVCKAEQTWYSHSRKVKDDEKERNDELMYDPQADDEDQKWVDDNRMKMKNLFGDLGNSDRKASKKEIGSDAVLNCPSCFVTLCRDCQRHSKYKNQYRAMFVTNCSVNYDQTVKIKSSNKKKKKIFKRHRKRAEQAAMDSANSSEKTNNNNSNEENTEEELYHPVNCCQCKTEVGVIDKDEVYHFFNVVASH